MLSATEQFEISTKCSAVGALPYSPPPMRAVRGYSLTYEQLNELLQNARKEVVEEFRLASGMEKPVQDVTS